MADEEWNVFAEEADTTIRAVEVCLLNVETRPATAEDLNDLYRGLHTLKGSSGFLSLRSFGRVAHACEELVGLARDHGVPLDRELVNLLLEALDRLRGATEFLVREHRDVAPEEVDDLVGRLTHLFQTRGGTTREAAFEGLLLFDDEVVDPVTAVASVNVPTPDAQAVVARERPRAEQASASEPRTEFLRIDGAKVSTLMELAGELGLACSAVIRHPELSGRGLDGFATAAHKLELLVREIQNDLSALRLVPVEPLFQRMRRVVRDAANTAHKAVELVIVGEETEVDKVMLDAISDPLIHVLRNAVDHGIESPSERTAAGKQPSGTITLSATHLGGAVCIEVRDDGRGVDRERVLARAHERNLVPEATALSDEAVLALLFLPGFSTKAQADQLSGRGVGMDVVKTVVESLRGRASLTSTTGFGARLTMTMPLTLAFVEAMVVRENGRLFALPIEKVFEVSQVDHSRVVKNSADGQISLWLRETCVPVMWLHKFWNEPRTESIELDGRLVVLVQTSRGAVAIPVDELIGNQQVMLKPLRGSLEHIRAASGCGMLRTGEVALALDCDRLHA